MPFWFRYFLDGSAFLLAAGMLTAAPLIPVAGRRGWAMLARIVLVIPAAIVVALSGTPLPLWFYAIWCAVLLAWVYVHCRSHDVKPAVAIAARGAAVLLALAALAWEASWQIAPRLAVQPGQKIYVIGDSISAGLELTHRGTWPDLLGRRMGVNMVNLSQAGAKVSAGLLQARSVDEPNAMVILEIGGNDLMNTDADDFRADYEKLILLLRAPQRSLVMMELPTLPLGNFYSMTLRDLARRYSIPLIPRRVLVDVWATPGATIDSVHLTPAGQQQLADRLAEILGPR